MGTSPDVDAWFAQLNHPLKPLMQTIRQVINAAGRLKGHFPHLEGRSVKYMYFASEAEVAERSVELQTIARAWIDYEDVALR
jgi:hypothetical protein